MGKALLKDIKATLEREPSVSSGELVWRVQRDILNDLMMKHGCKSKAEMQSGGLHSSTFQPNRSTFSSTSAVLVTDSNHQTHRIPQKVSRKVDECRP